MTSGARTATSRACRMLQRGRVVGAIQSTVEFTSPEVALGATVTLAADMWSAGALIYVS